MRKTANPVLIVALVASLGGCMANDQDANVVKAAAAPANSADAADAVARTVLGAGYLAPAAMPDPLAYLPPPPAAGSAAMLRDEEGQAAALALRGTPRWDQARADAELIDPSATGLFSCAAGQRISAQTTPAIQQVLRRATADLGLSGYKAKRQYMRQRPFMVNNQPLCTPEWESRLRQDGSYPSGHSAVGYGWGLILAEIFPDRAAQLVARGRAYGDSRRVCNVHWHADVEAGQQTATVVIARLHFEPAFRADLDAARAEAAAMASANMPPADLQATAACAAEAAALGS